MITCTFEDGKTTLLRHVVADTIVVKNDTILLVKRSEKLSLEPGKWTLPGGFVDRDETTKEAATREVLEESGYTVTHLRLLTIKDNPNRPHEDRQNIAFIYIADALEKKQEPDWEVSETKWFSFDSLPAKEDIAFDHYDNIHFFLEHKKVGTALPILSQTPKQ